MVTMFLGLRLIEFIIIITILVIIVLICQFIFIRKEKDKIKKALKEFFLMCVMLGLVLIIMSSLLPDLESHYPNNINQVQEPTELLLYLQSYNKAIVRTAETLEIFLMLFVIWFLISLCTFLNKIVSLKLLKKE